MTYNFNSLEFFAEYAQKSGALNSKQIDIKIVINFGKGPQTPKAEALDSITTFTALPSIATQCSSFRCYLEKNLTG